MRLMAVKTKEENLKECSDKIEKIMIDSGLVGSYFLIDENSFSTIRDKNPIPEHKTSMFCCVPQSGEDSRLVLQLLIYTLSRVAPSLLGGQKLPEGVEVYTGD